jgi:cytochrome P450
MTTHVHDVPSAFDPCEFVRTYHPYNADIQDDPYPLFDHVRAKCPVAWSEAMGGFWVVSRYEDCAFVLRRHDLFSASQNIVPPYQSTPLGPDLPNQVDPPEHGKYRSILNPPLSPPAVAKLEPRMRALSGQLLDAIAAKGGCDFLADFAVPFPSYIFVPLMGLPESDLDTFLAWKNQLLHNHERSARTVVQEQLMEYFTAVYHERRKLEDPGDDLIGHLIAARYDDERPLTLEEFVGIACLTWSAGLDTVTAQLSLAIYQLATRPHLRDQLVADPSLIPGAVEELMRFDSLVNDCRKALADVELGGQMIKAGDVVMLMYGAAGRDPEQFSNPYELDFRREPNRHFGFGGGVHRCAGSHLARLELRVAMDEIHRRIPNYCLDPDQPVVRHFGYVRGLDNLHLLV